MRDDKFIKDSIKMDLYRVVTAAGNINRAMPLQSIYEFMNHAGKDFEKTKLTNKELLLKQQLQKLQNELPQIKDPHSRLRWAEDILTIRCRL